MSDNDLSKLVVAGATGALGRQVIRLAKGRFKVIALGRDRGRLEQLGADRLIVEQRLANGPPPSSELVESLAGVDCVFSCIGASVQPTWSAGRKTYTRVDVPCNETLIAAAKQAGVGKFVYVAVANPDSFAGLAYVAAHERVVRSLVASGLRYAVVRPTGFFSAFLPILDMAKKGAVPLLGTPDEAKSNPIDDAELAQVCLEAVVTDFGEQEVGGPQILSRHELVRAAFQAVGKTEKTRRVPDAAVELMATCMYPFNPRFADITRFYLAVSNRNCIAPQRGQRTISQFFADQVGSA